MDEDKLRAIVKEVVNEAVDPIKQDFKGVVTRLDGIEGQLNDPDIGLAAINRKLDANTAAVVELESTVKGYADLNHFLSHQLSHKLNYSTASC